ncbi:MAG: SPOR domain-containing protein [Pseudomonadota bacterium]
MGNIAYWRTLGVAGILIAVAGCEDGALKLGEQQPPEDGQATAAAERPSATRIAGEEVEAPDVFQKSETGLWGGTPTFGGVWVAHPDVSAPERVRIRNEDNGQTVIGSLFKRERENPGPRFQVSADAANALTILAGQPTNLTVTALRREEIVPEPEVETTAEGPTIAPDARAIAAPEPVQTEALAAAAAAIDEAEGIASPDPEAVITPASVEAAAIAELEPLATEPEPAAATQTASRLAKPYVQLPTFASEDEATKATGELRKQGIVPILGLKSEDGVTTWRVIIGPHESRADRASAKRKLRHLGYKGMTFVAN